MVTPILISKHVHLMLDCLTPTIKNRSYQDKHVNKSETKHKMTQPQISTALTEDSVTKTNLVVLHHLKSS
jgi:hypothetical protein